MRNKGGDVNDYNDRNLKNFDNFDINDDIVILKIPELFMLPDALLSCSCLLIGCGSSIHQLLSHSYENFSRILPEFIFASIGIASIGARSLLHLGYHVFWRQYPIDPMLIRDDIKAQRNDGNIVDSSLSILGLASIIYALHHHHDCRKTGAIVVTSLTLAQVICAKEEWFRRVNEGFGGDSDDSIAEFRSMIEEWLTSIWIISTGLFGWTVRDNFIRLACIPWIISLSLYPPDPFYQPWSIKNSIADYMMLVYIMLITEALQTPVK